MSLSDGRHYVVETPRLRLREIGPADLEFIVEMLSDPEVMRFYPKPLSRDEAIEWIDRQYVRYARDGHGFWLVEKRDGGAPVGQVGLLTQDVPDMPKPVYPEIGYLLHRPFWKRGYATEAARGVRQYAFTTCGYDEVISLIRPENEPSQAVARRLGMTVRATVPFHGMSHLVYGLTREDATDDTPMMGSGSHE